jgi:hypothetical protein
MRPGFTSLGWVYHSLRRFYDEVDPVIIYCLPPLEAVQNNVFDDPDNEVVVDHIEGIYTAYLMRASIDSVMRPDKTLIWNYQVGHDLAVIDPLINYAKGRAEL